MKSNSGSISRSEFADRPKSGVKLTERLQFHSVPSRLRSCDEPLLDSAISQMRGRGDQYPTTTPRSLHHIPLISLSYLLHTPQRSHFCRQNTRAGEQSKATEMDALARQEYPAMLVSFPRDRRRLARELNLTEQQATLSPTQALQVFNDRIKRIGKINTEVADWISVSYAWTCAQRRH